MLAPLLFWAGFYAYFYANPGQGKPVEFGGEKVIAFSIACSEWILLTVAAGFSAFRLDAAARLASPQQSARPMAPFYSTIAFSLLVFIMRFVVRAPVELGALCALPIILLPPLTYRVNLLQAGKTPFQFSPQESSLVVDSAKASPLIRAFLERYPHTHGYLYRNFSPESAGGVILHNRERLSVEHPTHLEVTLVCPFTIKLGEFAEGREMFRAYLNRSKPEGCVIHNLPHQTWETWLIGLTQKEWFERIKELDTLSPNHSNTKGLPCQFIENDWSWKSIELM